MAISYQFFYFDFLILSEIHYWGFKAWQLCWEDTQNTTKLRLLFTYPHSDYQILDRWLYGPPFSILYFWCPKHFCNIQFYCNMQRFQISDKLSWKNQSTSNTSNQILGIDQKTFEMKQFNMIFIQSPDVLLEQDGKRVKIFQILWTDAKCMIYIMRKEIPSPTGFSC